MVDSSVANVILDSFFARSTLYKKIGSGESATYSLATPLSGACYIGVSTTTPTISAGKISGFTEPDPSTGYVRTRLGIGENSATWVMDAAANSEIANGTNFVFFDEAASGVGGFGTITWFGLFSAKSGGQPLVAGQLLNSVTVNEGNVLIFRPNNLKISMQ